MFKKNSALLAPMAGVTDMTFRSICKEMGCALTYSEMVSAKGLHYGGEEGRSSELLAMAENETPCAVQIFGSQPQIMGEQTAMICKKYSGKVALIDINMGCPAPKITTNGEGSALMKYPALASDIISAVVKNSDVPVTVKFRKGWDDSSVNAVEFAQMAQQSGASAITVHGRTRMQFYSGKADWDIISKVVNSVSVPVIANGDVFCAQDAADLLEHTGAQAVMVARGAQGNPWIFAQIKALAERGEQINPPSPAERIDMALRHAQMAVQNKGPRAVVEMRKHIAWYITGMKDSAKIRAAVNAIDDIGQLEELLGNYLKHL